jgi:4-diphosphocytidyl-2-C-methyl-D-erythritol kinase
VSLFVISREPSGSSAVSAAAIVAAAPAKLNLGLRVTGVRADGYHLLESVFVPLDLADALAIELVPAPSTRVALRVEGESAGLEAGGRNLAARAAAALLEAVGQPAEVRITLTKRIPVGAGMGGGSSDAGAVLRVLAECFPGAVPAPSLAALAVRLGADVPYFLDPRPALVRGVGDVIEPIASFPSLEVVVVTPAPPLATAAVFRAFDARPRAGSAPDSAALTPADEGRRMPPLPALLEELGKASSPMPPSPRRWQTLLAELLVNDLEPVAAGLHPAVHRLRTAIERAGARAVGMSGSGPSVFGVFDGADEARAAAARILWEPTDRVHVGRTAGSGSWGVV